MVGHPETIRHADSSCVDKGRFIASRFSSGRITAMASLCSPKSLNQHGRRPAPDSNGKRDSTSGAHFSSSLRFKLIESFHGRRAAAKRELNPDESRSRADRLRRRCAWAARIFAEEPHSEPGELLSIHDFEVAITYLLKYWDRLTLFLRQPGAPLDNNIVERGLKKAILHTQGGICAGRKVCRD
jgi:transposase IS66 family protein